VASLETPGEWRVIGTTHANHSVDHDMIVVKGPFDDFRQIKFKVTDAPLNLLRAGWGCRAPLHPADWIDTPTWDPRVPLRYC
jgi:hypothetical protein